MSCITIVTIARLYLGLIAPVFDCDPGIRSRFTLLDQLCDGVNDCRLVGGIDAADEKLPFCDSKD